MTDDGTTSGVCPTAGMLAAYHDGELSPPDRTAVAGHLAGCGGCDRLLAELRATSAWVASAATAIRLDGMSRERLHRRLREAADGSLLRLGWELSGVAAAVLLAGSVWLARQEATPAASVPPWVVATADGSRDVAVTPAAAWYLPEARAGDGGW